MKNITLVTGNKNKLKEFQAILGNKLESVDIDLEEIQSIDVEKVALDKVKRAYAILQKPVIVEDVSFELDELKGLPGPFIKFFEQKLGNGSLIKLLGDSKNRAGRAVACIGYCDEEKEFTVRGELQGVVAHELADDTGFGFDSCFIPNGYTQTLSQMSKEEKNKISHRRKAIVALKETIMQTNI